MRNIEFPSQVNFRTILGIKKYLYFPLITVLVVVGLLFLLVIPSLRKISLLRGEISDETETKKVLIRKEEVLKSLDEAQLLSQVERLERAVPSRKDVYSLLASLNGLAFSNGVSLSRFSLTPGSLATASASSSATSQTQVSEAVAGRGETAALSLLEAAVEVSGPFDGVKAFLLKLESLVPLMRLISLELTPATEETTTSISTHSAFPVVFEVTANLVIDMFYAPLPTQLGVITDPVQEITDSEKNVYERILSFTSFSASPSATVSTGREDIFAPF